MWSLYRPNGHSNLSSLGSHPHTQHHRGDHDPITTHFHRDSHARADLGLVAWIRATTGRSAVRQRPIDISRCTAVAVVHSAHSTRVHRRATSAIRHDLIQEGTVVRRIAAAHLVPLTHARHIARGVAPVVVVMVPYAVWVCVDAAVQPESRENCERRDRQCERRNTSRRRACASGIWHDGTTGVSVPVRLRRARAIARTPARVRARAK